MDTIKNPVSDKDVSSLIIKHYFQEIQDAIETDVIVV